MIIDESDYLAHYGILRRSGRYPWGSGDNVAQRSKSFLDYIQEMRNQGLSDKEIAEGLGMKITELRNTNTIARAEKKAADIAMAQRLREKGMSNVAIGERMGIPESSVRNLLAPGAKDRTDVLMSTANMLKDRVDEVKYLDIGSGQENWIGVSQTKLGAAVSVLQDAGYEVHKVKLPQVGTKHETEYKVLALPGTTQKEVWLNRHNIQQMSDFSEDGGRTYSKVQPPLNISSKRVGVRYAEDGGTDADGVIYVRPGVDDVSLGGKNYAQVRIAVDGTHYLKGMAIYRDDLPPGVDLLFNTNKSNTGNKLDAMKKMETDKDGNIDPQNPFGSQIRRQILGPDDKPTSVMNKIYEEGDWDTWSRNLSTQFLSKQHPKLAKQQLDMAFEQKKLDYDEIMALTNPAVKRTLLQKLADDADASAVHMKAAQLPRQSSHVILPMPDMKPTEIYAPNFKNGERVVLVRHPHGGTFEIPELVVNNRHAKARKLLGDLQDAVGIHPKVAEKLSGADFDGDTVLVIPNNNRQVKTSPSLAKLKDFDPKRAYPAYPGMKPMDERTKQIQMGLVSNLITDMTIRGASQDELARAVRHSMVVIDAEKHKLNYRQSAIDNGISQLMKEYQGKPQGGASTLISRANRTQWVEDRKPRSAAKGGPIDPDTGERRWEPTGRMTRDRDGNLIPRQIKSKMLAETNDANTLSSGSTIEKIYADHSNRLKALANQARLDSVRINSTPYSPSAKAAYSNEVASLESKLNLALKNRPRERQAQVIANAAIAAKRQANPGMDEDDLKKVKSMALAEARTRTRADTSKIEITPDEWSAIQAGAISNHKLTQILNKADLDQVRQYATPRQPKLMTDAKTQRAQSMLALGYTQSEVAEALGVSLTTLKKTLS